MEHLIEFGMFAGKTILIIVGIIAIIGTIAAKASSLESEPDKIEVTDLNKKFKSFAKTLKAKILNKKELKNLLKLEKKSRKQKTKEEKSNIFVVEFDGDIKATEVKNLRDEITSILDVADKDDEVVAIVNSPGGMVHTYGLAAAQLDRVKKAKIKLTVVVDKVAASGGYMMACTADRIIASPFAIIGSIGVLAQVPNFNRFLKKHDVDYQEITAGEYKRTLSLFGEITDKGKEKFTEQIESTHGLFKEFVKQHRPQVDIDSVATGEYWFASQALEKKLVDEIGTSDDYLFAKKDSHRILKVKLIDKKKLGDKLTGLVGRSVEASVDKLLDISYKNNRLS